MPADPWDNIPSGDFVQWEEVGQSLVGDIISKGVSKDFNDNPAPELGIRQDDGTEVLVTAGQAQLKAKLLEARPNVGDRIKITFTQLEKRGGGKTLKHFDVVIKTGGAKSKVEPEPAAAADAADDDF